MYSYIHKNYTVLISYWLDNSSFSCTYKHKSIPTFFLASHIYLFPRTFAFHPLFSIFPLISSKIFRHGISKICNSSKSVKGLWIPIINKDFSFIFKGRQHKVAMNGSALWSLILQIKPYWSTQKRVFGYIYNKTQSCSTKNTNIKQTVNEKVCPYRNSHMEEIYRNIKAA